MKLRISGDSIRLRLSQTEVDSFGNTGVCTNQLTFPDGKVLTYKLVVGADYAASYDQSIVRIALAKEEVDAWAKTDQVSIKAIVPMSNDSAMEILVEKDFQCLTNREEDQSDLYPNPKDSH